MQTDKRPQGVFAFMIIWIGQIVSILASGMSQFALTIWMYQQTKSPMAMALMTVFYITPFLLLSPFAGVMVDRYNRKVMMMLSDLTAVGTGRSCHIGIAFPASQGLSTFAALSVNGNGFKT